jgi:DNA polymerase elongation subunit (family B)
VTPTVFDVECYRNFFLVLFKRLDTGEIIRVQKSPNRVLNRTLLLHTLQTSLLVGFNSDVYDIPMIQLALKGYSVEELKGASDDIIQRDMKYRDFAQLHDISRPAWNHVDLKEVAPLDASLKLYGGRLYCPKLQDLPIDPEAYITPETAATIVRYCQNDLDITATLYKELEQQIQLRDEMSKVYKQDLRSRSDAQVAERVIAHEVAKINGVRPQAPKGLDGQSYKYRVPDFIQYRNPTLQKLLAVIREADFTVGYSGSIELPPELKEKAVKVAGGTYRIGIGGLHSSETSCCHLADDNTLLVDRDVASYYPSIILNQGLYPQHLGEAFLTVYRTLVERRLAAKDAAKEAKKQGDKAAAQIHTSTAESLKIAINGSFGKLGSKYSVLYSPDLLIQVTITGQLSLLLLIERIEEYGIRVISANTDGIVIKCPKGRYDLLGRIIAQWEQDTGFKTDEALYRAVYSKDVNNYIAIKDDGTVKGKGLYANPWEVNGPNVFKLHKNPSTTIVIEAVVALLRDGIPLEDTIQDCKDIRKFTAVRKVTGGAKLRGDYLGKVVRWYYARNSRDVINYQKSGNKVPKSDNSRPLMELPDTFPTDVNYAWYIQEAKNALSNIGYTQGSLFGH